MTNHVTYFCDRLTELAFYGPLSKSESKFRFFQNLGFHDCVSGCDGCINLDNAANNGLSPAIDAMEEILTEITGAGISVSRADLWAIGGRAAAEFGMENMPGNSGWVKGVNRRVLLVCHKNK